MKSRSNVFALVVEDEPLHAVDVVDTAGFEPIEAGNADHAPL
jgi:hypothetical protein